MKKSSVLYSTLLFSIIFACGCDEGSGSPGPSGSHAGAAGSHAGAAGGDSSSGGTSGAGGADATGGTGGGNVITGPVFPPDVTTPKIMIVGDSISAGPGCWKKYLLQNLQDNGYTDFEFVGEYTDDCGGGVMHSAVSCTTSYNFTQETFMVSACFPDEVFPGMATLVATHDPDMILIQLGVNDVWGGSAAIDPILNNYSTLVEQARAHNPNIVIVVAQIHKIITNDCANDASTTNAQELVEAVPGWAAGVTTEDSPVFVADLWTNSDPTEAADCVHPNDAGAQRMGLNWYNALQDLLPHE